MTLLLILSTPDSEFLYFVQPHCLVPTSILSPRESIEWWGAVMVLNCCDSMSMLHTIHSFSHTHTHTGLRNALCRGKGLVLGLVLQVVSRFRGFCTVFAFLCNISALCKLVMWWAYDCSLWKIHS